MCVFSFFTLRKVMKCDNFERELGSSFILQTTVSNEWNFIVIHFDWERNWISHVVCYWPLIEPEVFWNRSDEREDSEPHCTASEKEMQQVDPILVDFQLKVQLKVLVLNRVKFSFFNVFSGTESSQFVICRE